MYDHVSVKVTDIAASRAFYVDASKTLGVAVIAENDGFLMMGGDGPKFVIAKGDRATGPVHIALAATTRDAVRRFHAAAVAAGGRDHGAPGLRPNYAPTYYGAFVFDPDGNNIEAVCHADGE